MKRISFFLLLAVLVQFVYADSSILDEYIKAGLKNNLVLKQEQFSLEKSLHALKEARGMFLPSVSIEARYTGAGGGRIIDLPIGDLVNPLHQSLNQLLGYHGQAPVFPGNLPNEKIPFLRPSEHETKLRVVQPVFLPAINFNSRIKRSMNRIQKARVDAFKRKLVLDIKEAYFSYLKTVKIKEILESTRILLEENLRVSKSLFRNHKVTEEIVFRSQAEKSKLERQIAEADKNVLLSSSFFNFLLNRPMDTDIKIDKDFNLMFKNELDLEELESHAVLFRSEFFQLHNAIDAAKSSVKLYRSKKLPAITAVVDYGFQGVTYSFTGEDDYWMASLLMSWSLYRGGQDRAKKMQAILDKKRLEAQLSELDSKIRLQVRELYHNLIVARKSMKSAGDLLSSRKKAFQIVSKKYEEGMVPQIEYIQARNNFTMAEVNKVITKYDLFIKEAYLEYGSALYKFNEGGSIK